jgi:soluble lytic murein transglycosylase-like protein
VLALAISKAESGIGTNNRRSSAGACGPLQVLPSTGRSMGANPCASNEGSILAGVRFLKTLTGQFGSNLTNVAWGYNAGPGSVGRKLPAQTRAYIGTVQQAYAQLQGLISI